MTRNNGSRPKSGCPFENFTVERGLISAPQPCTGAPLENGWCKEHQRSFEVSQAGARLGYPRMQINEHLWVGEGELQWEGLAMRLAGERLERWGQVVQIKMSYGS